MTIYATSVAGFHEKMPTNGCGGMSAGVLIVKLLNKLIQIVLLNVVLPSQVMSSKADKSFACGQFNTGLDRNLDMVTPKTQKLGGFI